LAVAFEELVGTPAARFTALARVLRHVAVELPTNRETAVVASMEEAIDPSDSSTFRQGLIGAWRDEFDDVTKRVFGAIAGDLLIDLGYEIGNDW
jgi:hypothetical protein